MFYRSIDIYDEYFLSLFMFDMQLRPLQELLRFTADLEVTIPEKRSTAKTVQRILFIVYVRSPSCGKYQYCGLFVLVFAHFISMLHIITYICTFVLIHITLLRINYTHCSDATDTLILWMKAESQTYNANCTLEMKSYFLDLPKTCSSMFVIDRLGCLLFMYLLEFSF